MPDWRGLAIVVTIFTGAGVPHSAVAAPLKSTGNWVVDYGDAQCTARKAYGTAEKPLYLVFKPSPLGGVMRILLMQKGSGQNAIQDKIRVTFASGSPIDTSVLDYGVSETKTKVASVNVPMALFLQQRTSPIITLKGGSTNHSFAVSGLTKAVDALEVCRADLRKVWNIDSGLVLSQTAQPLKPLIRYFSANDYPEQAVSEIHEGRADVALLIDEAGRIKDCSIEVPSGAATLDTMSCYVFQKRAKFKPALGPDGNPVKSSYSSAISWRVESW